MVTEALADLRAQAEVDGDYDGLLARYPKAVTGDFDGDPATLSEMDAVIAYLQILGQMVAFTDVEPGDLRQ
jgi:cytochrome c oxidase cbb3-type subunit 2